MKTKNTPLNNFLFLILFGSFLLVFFDFIFTISFMSFMFLLFGLLKNICSYHQPIKSVFRCKTTTKHIFMFLLKKFVLEYDDFGTMIKRQFGS